MGSGDGLLLDEECVLRPLSGSLAGWLAIDAHVVFLGGCWEAEVTGGGGWDVIGGGGTDVGGKWDRFGGGTFVTTPITLPLSLIIAPESPLLSNGGGGCGMGGAGATAVL
jgi:hypothetical protein